MIDTKELALFMAGEKPQVVIGCSWRPGEFLLLYGSRMVLCEGVKQALKSDYPLSDDQGTITYDEMVTDWVASMDEEEGAF